MYCAVCADKGVMCCVCADKGVICCAVCVQTRQAAVPEPGAPAAAAQPVDLSQL